MVVEYFPTPLAPIRLSPIWPVPIWPGIDPRTTGADQADLVPIKDGLIPI